ncbi:hypothetical protein J4219_04150 [Candidatus Woesearchaeota archaeon]|nr:hypothetical protein [Candidatus Woesearchaeota archaeon]
MVKKTKLKKTSPRKTAVKPTKPSTQKTKKAKNEKPTQKKELNKKQKKDAVKILRAEGIDDASDREKSTAEIAQETADAILTTQHFISIGDPDRPTIYVYENGYYTPNGKQKINLLVQQILGAFATRNMKNEVTSKIYSMTCKTEFPEAPPELFCVQNGILNVFTKKITPHTPETPFLQKIDVKYDSNAKCPEFEKFLEEILPTTQQNDRAVLKKWFGYTLLRDYRFANFLMLEGEGANGKSTLLRAMTKFIGQKNISTISPHNMRDRFSVVNLHGKLANIVPDISGKNLDKQSVSTIKTITGGDTITGEYKFGAHVNLNVYAKLAFSANELPQLPEDDTAMWRRPILILFKQKFEEKNADTKKSEKITTPNELSGMLNFALDGLNELLNAKGFGAEVAQTREIYLRKTDPVLCFVMDCTIKADDEKELKDDVYFAYRDYCDDREIECFDENDFFKKLYAKASYTRSIKKRIEKSEKRVHYVRGIKLKTAKKEENEDNTEDNQAKLFEQSEQGEKERPRTNGQGGHGGVAENHSLDTQGNDKNIVNNDKNIVNNEKVDDNRKSHCPPRPPNPTGQGGQVEQGVPSLLFNAGFEKTDITHHPCIGCAGSPCSYQRSGKPYCEDCALSELVGGVVRRLDLGEGAEYDVVVKEVGEGAVSLALIKNTVVQVNPHKLKVLE